MTANDSLLRRHMPELDVLRGVAILAVVLYHALYWYGHGLASHGLGGLILRGSVVGWLGVNLFFVLSGFLITGMLLDSKSEPHFYRRFYLRRALRILPAYVVAIVALLALHRIGWRYALLSALFVANYSRSLGRPISFAPLKSLSVEEQFYLVWPAIVRHTSIRTLTWLTCAICIVEPILRLLSAKHVLPQQDLYFNTAFMADNLALGALAAIFARSHWGTLRNARRVGVTLILAALAAELIGLPFGIAHRSTTVGVVLQAEPWNLFFTGLMLWMLGRRRQFSSSRWAAPLRFFGYISYGLYLFHLIVFELYDTLVSHAPLNISTTLQSPYPRLLLAGGAAVAAAWLSRKYLENPFLRIKAVPTDPPTELLASYTNPSAS